MATPRVEWRGSTDPDAPLVVLLHGRGSNEHDIIQLADRLPSNLAYAAVRGPIDTGPGAFAWFENRGIGRPVAESLREQMTWFTTWLDGVAPAPRRVILIGFSGGAAFAGGLALDDSSRYDGVAVLYGTLPFDAGVPTTRGRLRGLPVLHARAEDDRVIPSDLLDRTWAYLTGGAGAHALTLRHLGGHGIDPGIMPELVRWIGECATPSENS